jgi:hypothetical protein
MEATWQRGYGTNKNNNLEGVMETKFGAETEGRTIQKSMEFILKISHNFWVWMSVENNTLNIFYSSFLC